MHLHMGVHGDSCTPENRLEVASWGHWATARLGKVRQRSLRGPPGWGHCREREVPGKEASSQTGVKPYR